MRLPPAFLRIKLRSTSFWFPGLWLPLFLVWLMAMPLLIPLLLTLWIVAGRGPYWKLAKSFYQTVCEARGTEVNMETPTNQVLISIR